MRPRWPCVEFAKLDVCDPGAVGRFMYWLYHGHWPEELTAMEEPGGQGQEERRYSPEERLAAEWGLDAPRPRMAKLLWQLLQGNNDETYFRQHFTASLDALIEDAESCGDVLPPIQRKIRWVLNGFQERLLEDRDIRQGAAGEACWLPPEQAEYLRSQLRLAHADLIERPSDYEEFLRFRYQWGITHVLRAVEIPSTDPDRIYVGTIEGGPNESQVIPTVWVESMGKRYPLVNARHPLYYGPGTGFGWGYAGSGPNDLAFSILADAVGGDLVLPERLFVDFASEVLARLTWLRPFSLSRREVLHWLGTKGITESQLLDHQAQCEARRQKYAGLIEELRAPYEAIRRTGQRHLRVQRFDVVPPTFESAICLDLMRMLESSTFLLPCSGCGLPIACDNSPRCNRQRARWRLGKPVYHPECARTQALAKKRLYWRRRAEDPAFRERNRERARRRRMVGVVQVTPGDRP